MDIDDLINKEDNLYIPKHSQTLMNKKNKRVVIVKRKRRGVKNTWVIVLLCIFVFL